MISVNKNEIEIKTKTLNAVFKNGVLASLVRRKDEKLLIKNSVKEFYPLQLIFPNAEAVSLGGESRDKVVNFLINDYKAEVRFHCWNGDGILCIMEDKETGDIIVEPSGYSSRPGLRSVRWAIGGIAKELELVAPFFQGVKLEMEDELIANTRWHWPHFWEAGLAIFQGDEGGFFIH